MNSDRHQCRQTRKNNAGMTLVELVLAVGVLAMALGIMFSSIISMYRMGAIAEGRTRAAMVMTSVMEDLRTMSFEQVLAHNPNPVSFEDPSVVVQLELFASDGSAVTLPTAPGALTFPNPVEVRATVFWTEQPRERTYSMSGSTLLGRR